jgi:hypothetical protein
MKSIIVEECRKAIKKCKLGAGGSVKTAPDQICPKCYSGRIIWVEIILGKGYNLCLDCGKAGWD